MKVIDLLNKIANGEINEDIKVEYQYGFNYEYCTIREFFDRYIVDKENLNQEITLEDIPKEDKKIEKLNWTMIDGNCIIGMMQDPDEKLRVICQKFDEIIEVINERNI